MFGIRDVRSSLTNRKRNTWVKSTTKVVDDVDTVKRSKWQEVGHEEWYLKKCKMVQRRPMYYEMDLNSAKQR